MNSLINWTIILVINWILPNIALYGLNTCPKGRNLLFAGS